MSPRKVVVAPDSFKGSMTALEACHAISEGLREVWADAEIACVPMADGGEGTVRALVDATRGRVVELRVTGPLGDPVDAFYGLLGDGRTAAIEMAAASGLPLVPISLRDPTIATTYGTGELIGDALARGARRLIVGIGGSATNDGGAGMAQALGFRLLDARGRDLAPGGAALRNLARVEPPASGTIPDDLEVTVACDVDNPLCGPRGASSVYGPQKGATPAEVRELDAGLAHFATILERDLGADVADLPGAGAAGGLGAGLVAFLDGALVPGAEVVMDAVGLREKLSGAALCITGEGRLDSQTPNGKAPAGVARLAAELGIPVVAIGGCVDSDAREALSRLFAASVSTVDDPRETEALLRDGRRALTRTAGEVARLLSLGKSVCR